MKRFAWPTDVHLNFLEPDEAEAFYDSLAETDADAFLITGDIGEAPNVADYLNALDHRLDRPVYLILGNHDYYRGSIVQV